MNLKFFLFLACFISLIYLLPAQEPARVKEEPEVVIPPPGTVQEPRWVLGKGGMGLSLGPNMSWPGGKDPLFHFGGDPAWNTEVSNLKKSPVFWGGLELWGLWRLKGRFGLATTLGYNIYGNDYRFNYRADYPGFPSRENGSVDAYIGQSFISLRLAPSFNFSKEIRFFVNPGIELARIATYSWTGTNSWSEANGGNYDSGFPQPPITAPSWDVALHLEAGYRIPPRKEDKWGRFHVSLAYRHGLTRSVDNSLYSRALQLRLGYRFCNFSEKKEKD